jgi:zinc protease
MLTLMLATALATDPELRPVALCYPSGLRIAVEPRPRRPLVGIATVVDGGSSAEERGEEGVAHLVEHLWFRSPQLGYPSVDEALADIGASSNAFTTFDNTVYISVAPRRAARALLALEVARLTGTLMGVSEDDFNVERDVVQQELLLRTDGQQTGSGALAAALLPPEHAYVRSIGGTGEQVGGLDLGVAQAYADRAYTIDNVSILVAGDLEVHQVITLVRTSFPSALLAAPDAPEAIQPAKCTPSVPEPIPPPDPPAQTSWPEVVADVDERVALFGWTGPAHPAALDQLEVSVDVANWRGSEHSAEVSCHVSRHAQVAMVSCAVPAPLDGPDPVKLATRWTRAAQRAYLTLRDGTGAKNAMWRARVKYLRSQRREADRQLRGRIDPSPDGHLYQTAVAHHNTSQHQRMSFAYDTPLHDMYGMVVKRGKEVLSLDRMRGVVLVPATDGGSAGATVHGARGTTRLRTRDPSFVDEHTLSRVIVPPPLDLLSVATLDNGMQSWTLEAPVQAGKSALVIAGGRAWDDQLIQVTATSERIGDVNRAVMEAKHENHLLEGRSVRLAWGRRHWTWVAEGGSATWGAEALAAAMHAKLPLNSQKNHAWLAEQLEQYATEVQTDPRLQAAQIRWWHLAPGVMHPYFDDVGRAGVGAHTRSAARAFVDTWLDPAHATLITVNRRPVHANDMLEPFKTWETDSPTPPAVSLEIAETAERAVWVLQDSRPRALAKVVVSCRVASGNNLAIWLAEEALGSNVNDVLRNQLGATYGVRATTWTGPAGTGLDLTTTVGQAATGQALSTMLSTLDVLAAGELPADRLAQLKLEVARSTALRWQTSDDLIRLLRSYVLEGAVPEPSSMAGRLAALEPADVALPLEQCRGHEVVTIIGDAAQVGASLDAARIAYNTPPPP